MQPDCTCPGPDPEGYGSFNECELHVHCDADCKALKEPETLDEIVAALEHWRGHQLQHGCSHAC